MAKLWEKSYPAGVRWDTPLDYDTLTAEFDTAVATYADRPFLEFNGFTIDFKTMGALVERAARGFRALGVKPGSVVALHLPNLPQYPIAFYGALKAGAAITNLSPLDAEREIGHKLLKAHASIVVSFTGLDAKLPKDRPDLRVVLCSPQDMAPVPPPEIPDDPRLPVAFPSLLDPRRPAGAPWPQAKVEDLALLQFTGGTTGLPKAATLTHGNLTGTVSMFDAWTVGGDFKTVNGHDRLLAVLPLFHIYALTFGLVRGVRTGCQMLLKLRWDTDDIIETIVKHRPTLFAGVPTMFTALAAHPRAREIDWSSLHFCNSGGAPLPMELRDQFEAISGRALLEGWGMTETSAAGTGTPINSRKSGSAGIPLPGALIEIRGLDDPHAVMGVGEKGEICVGGINVTAGYYEQPAENAEAFVDGLFRTGDIGYFDEDGFLFIVDRKKDMILSGGFNVYPRYLEEAIYEHPSVEEVIVIGIPDAYRGESAKAFIKLRRGAEPITLEALRLFLTDKLGKHELPAALEIRDALPKTAVGKLWKKALVDEEKAKAAASA